MTKTVFHRASALLLSVLLSVSALCSAATAAETEPKAEESGKSMAYHIDRGRTAKLTVYKYEVPDASVAYSGSTGAKDDESHIPEDAKPLGGVTFAAHKFAELDEYFTETSSEIPKVEDYAEEKVIAKFTATTNADGVAEFKDLPLGFYYVDEINGPAQITKKIEPFVLSLPLTNAEGTEWLYDVYSYPKNETGYGDASLQKLDLNSEEPLENAEFTLESYGTDNAAPVATIASEIKTGENGIVTVTSLPAQTYYRFTETKAPDESYILDGSVYYEFYIDSTGDMISGWTSIDESGKPVDGQAVENNTLVVKNEKPTIHKYILEEEKSPFAFDKSRNETAGIDGQFSAISKKNRVRTDDRLTHGVNKGRQAANSQFTAQSNDIASKVKTGNKESAIRENEVLANRYRGNIQNAALAEQARARASGSALSDKDALKKAYENHGFSCEQAESLAHRDVSSGGYGEKKEKFDNSISAQAKQRYEANPTEYRNMGEAYRSSASEHYKALGFDESTANSLATETANRVLVDDMQTVVRENAQSALSKATAEELNSYVDKKGNPLPREEIERQCLTNSATEILSNSASVGYTGSINDAVDQMLEQGTLREGVQRGRIANNVQRERAEFNTRAAALGREELGPGARAAATMTVGYFGERMMETLHDSGYKVGSKKKERRTRHKTTKQGERAKKKR